ncbi:hypothetical protein HKD37_10G028371 [Glycine soja]
MTLQYPLLFPYGEDRYRHDILHKVTSLGPTRKRMCLTIREWFSFKLQFRLAEAQTLLHSRKLFQEFVVDDYTMVESERLAFIRMNQSKLSVDKYSNLHHSSDVGATQGSNRVKRIILPLTFVGSPRYMEQLYFDGMTICSNVGIPDLFITFTCNPNWREIQRLLSPMNLKVMDRHDVISRVFRIKFEQMLTDLTKQHLLGKYPTPEDIDRVICAEIPSKDEEKQLYQVVQAHMIHGPCGIINLLSPCMKDGLCSNTILDADSYPLYQRIDTGNTMTKNGVLLDNRSLVPYNRDLSLRYHAHINIE